MQTFFKIIFFSLTLSQNENFYYKKKLYMRKGADVGFFGVGGGVNIYLLTLRRSAFFGMLFQHLKFCQFFGQLF